MFISAYEYFIYTAFSTGSIATRACCSGHLQGKGDQSKGKEGTESYMLSVRHTPGTEGCRSSIKE